MFVIALGVSDILMSICCMPFTVITLFHGRWIFGESYCRFEGFGALTFALVSLVTMGLIAVSRYYCVVKPEKYVSRPLGVWRELLSISRLRSFHTWSGLSSDYGINCNKSMLPCRQTRKVRGVIQNTKSFTVRCCCLVRGPPWIIASIFLQESRI